MNAKLSLTWGEQGREVFDRLNAVRSFLIYESTLIPEEVEVLIRTGQYNEFELKREKTP